MIQIIDKNGYTNQAGSIQIINNSLIPDYNFISVIAGETINGGKAVFVDTDGLLYIVDITNPSHYEKCVGIAIQSVIAGDSCNIITSGYTSLLGSGWLPGEIYYISLTGLLTAIPPVIGWCQKIAMGINNDIISINIEKGVELI